MNILVIPVYLQKISDITLLKGLLRTIHADKYIDKHIIVDDGSPYSISLLGQVIKLRDNMGPAYARNVGMQRALEMGADNIFFTDLDCELQPGWGREFTEYLKMRVIAGGITYASGNTVLDKYHNINGTLNGRFILPRTEDNDLLYTPTCNMAISSVVAKQFSFNEEFETAAGEDVDFCLRVRQKYSIGLCRGAIVKHNWGYRSTWDGIPKFISTLKKYQKANGVLRRKHLSLPQSERISSL
jgi:GT2 family glycosyltransferase